MIIGTSSFQFLLPICRELGRRPRRLTAVPTHHKIRKQPGFHWPSRYKQISGTVSVAPIHRRDAEAVSRWPRPPPGRSGKRAAAAARKPTATVAIEQSLESFPPAASSHRCG
ncbi:hypothetical protein GWI33_017738 [Rhynchophorus ferrugineus]|uniref:Uncharacterized protein n=1 Tax=Rhynchophorus ferrugineus TaxID=354439 RepID=A0A834HXX8_RHYFE|nr:hypothetical protein GWI33_017738 [Rhynchophorus ferrugineus]